ncbi:MAG: nuclear transport factor 2 family protein [Methylovirgula sp.]
MTTPTDTIRAFYSALGRGDVPGVLALLHDELEWTEAERFPYYSGTWRSPEAVRQNVLLKIPRDWDRFSITANDFIAEGDQVVSFGTYGGVYKTTGRTMHAAFAHRWRVRDGRIAAFTMYIDTAKVLEALG